MQNNTLPKIIIIAGATASGKSSLAISLSKKLNAEIVSADSMQIYRGLNIGTAKNAAEELSEVKHHMIDAADPRDDFSVADYVEAAIAAIDDIIRRGKTPIIAGGTGLYIDGLLYRRAYGSAASDAGIREKLSAAYDEDGGIKLYDKMLSLDPEDTAKYHRNNRHRLLRAWEIYLLSGRTKTQMRDAETLRYDADIYIIECTREDLYRRIDERVDKMIAAGLVEEIKGLLADGVTFDMQSMQAIGYKEFKDYFNDTKSLAEVIDEIKLNTRHYAKRQLTWFKRYRTAKSLAYQEIEKTVLSKYSDEGREYGN